MDQKADNGPVSALSAVCPSRYWLDVLSAVGPTLAAGVAVGVSVWATLVARQSVAAMEASTALQRAISRPRLSVPMVPGVDVNGVSLTVRLRNSGLTVAHVLWFKVLVEGKEQPYQFESGSDFWFKVLAALGLTQVGALHGAMLKSSVHIPAGESLPLLSAVFHNTPEPLLRAALERLKFAAEYRSMWGDVYKIPADD
jgi:hypothetical protein